MNVSTATVEVMRIFKRRGRSLVTLTVSHEGTTLGPITLEKGDKLALNIDLDTKVKWT